MFSGNNVLLYFLIKIKPGQIGCIFILNIPSLGRSTNSIIIYLYHKMARFTVYKIDMICFNFVIWKLKALALSQIKYDSSISTGECNTCTIVSAYIMYRHLR